MALAELHLRYRPEEFDNHGELTGSIRCGAFSGEGSAWFNLHELRDIFLPALRTYPLPADSLPKLVGAKWRAMADGSEIVGADLATALAPHGAKGAILVEITLSTDSNDWRSSARQSATTRFFTEYAETERFAQQFEKMLVSPETTAVMRGRTDL